LSGKKGFTYQIHEEKNFHSITETPNHAYWHRIYNTPAAFETVYQDYTTKLDKHGTTPQKSAPGTADPDPQPGACWSVTAIPDGTQLKTIQAPGTGAEALAWDGSNWWLSDEDCNYVYKMSSDLSTVQGGFLFSRIHFYRM